MLLFFGGRSQRMIFFDATEGGGGKSLAHLISIRVCACVSTTELRLGRTGGKGRVYQKPSASNVFWSNSSEGHWWWGGECTSRCAERERERERGRKQIKREKRRLVCWSFFLSARCVGIHAIPIGVICKGSSSALADGLNCERIVTSTPHVVATSCALMW